MLAFGLLVVEEKFSDARIQSDRFHVILLLISQNFVSVSKYNNHD